MKLRRRCWVLLAAVPALGAALAGCEGPAASPAQRVANMPLEKNVIAVARFFSPNPFGRVGGSEIPGGFVVNALYLIGPSGKGVFGDGIIHVYLYELHRPDGGDPERQLIREWLFNPEQALPYRAKNETALGWGYMLHCVWGDLDLRGREVEIHIQFERTDGRVVAADPLRKVVPATS
jgi:hypothetical protein